MIIPTEMEARFLWVMQGGAEWRAPSFVLQQVVPTEQSAQEILADLVEKGWVNRNLKVVARANVTTYRITGAGREALSHTHFGDPATQPHPVTPDDDLTRDEARRNLAGMIPADDEPGRLPGILPDPPHYGTLTGLSEDDWSLVLSALNWAADTTVQAETEGPGTPDLALAEDQARAFRALYDRLATSEVFESPGLPARWLAREWHRIRPGLQGRILSLGGHGEGVWAWVDFRERRDG